jgi:hypothetical protein
MALYDPRELTVVSPDFTVADVLAWARTKPADGSNASNCSSCEQPYDPAGWCEACRQFAHEELPEKTLAQWIAENREMAAAIRVQAMMALHREAMKSREAY